MNKLNRLEEEIYQALLKAEGIQGIEDGNPITAGICRSHAIIAAKISMPTIEKAFDAGNFYTAKGRTLTTHEEDKQSWLRDNNLYAEPQTKDYPKIPESSPATD